MFQNCFWDRTGLNTGYRVGWGACHSNVLIIKKKGEVSVFGQKGTETQDTVTPFLLGSALDILCTGTSLN